MDIKKPQLDKTIQHKFPKGAKKTIGDKEVSVGGRFMSEEDVQEYSRSDQLKFATKSETGAVSKEQFDKFRDEFKKYVDEIANKKFGEGFGAAFEKTKEQPSENMSKLFDTLASKINSQLSVLNTSISNLKSSSENYTNKLINFSSAIHGEVAGHTDILQQIADNIGNNSGNIQTKQLTTTSNSDTKNPQTKLVTLILKHLGKIEKHLAKIESSLVANSTKLTPLPSPVVNTTQHTPSASKDSNKVIMSKNDNNKMSRLELFLDGISKLVGGGVLLGLGSAIKKLTDNFSKYEKQFNDFIKKYGDTIKYIAELGAAAYAAKKAWDIISAVVGAGKAIGSIFSKNSGGTTMPDGPDNKPKTKPSGEPTKKPPMDMEKLEPYGKRDGEAPSGESPKTKPSGESPKTKPSGESPKTKPSGEPKVSKKQSKISKLISKTTDIAKKGVEVAKSVGGKVIEKAAPLMDDAAKIASKAGGAFSKIGGKALSALTGPIGAVAGVGLTAYDLATWANEATGKVASNYVADKMYDWWGPKVPETNIVPNVSSKNATPISATTNNIKAASTELAAQAIPVKNDKPIIVNNNTTNNSTSGSNIGSIASPKNTDSSKEVLDRMMLFGSYTGTGFLLN